MPRRWGKLRGGPFFHHTGPPKNCCSTLVESTQSGLMTAANACGFEKIPPICCRFVCRGLEAMWLTNVQNQVSTWLLVHQCPCGRPMHAFSGRGIGAEGHGRQRECSDCQQRKDGDHAGSSNPMKVDGVACFFYVSLG